MNNKLYVGQTNDPKRRWSIHKCAAKKAKPKFYIHRAMAKDDIENFTFMTIEEHETREAANEAEEFWIGYFQTLNHEYGYNLKHGGNAGPHTEETKAKISAASKALWERDYERMREATTPHAFKAGHEVKEEWISKMVAAHAGIPGSEESKVKRSNSLKAHYARIGGSTMKGRVQSQEEIEKRAASLTGLKRTDATKARMRASNNSGRFVKGQNKSQETIQRMREAQQRRRNST